MDQSYYTTLFTKLDSGLLSGSKIHGIDESANHHHARREGKRIEMRRLIALRPLEGRARVRDHYLGAGFGRHRRHLERPLARRRDRHGHGAARHSSPLARETPSSRYHDDSGAPVAHFGSSQRNGQLALRRKPLGRHAVAGACRRKIAENDRLDPPSYPKTGDLRPQSSRFSDSRFKELGRPITIGGFQESFRSRNRRPKGVRHTKNQRLVQPRGCVICRGVHAGRIQFKDSTPRNRARFRSVLIIAWPSLLTPF